MTELEAAREVIYLFRRGSVLGEPQMDKAMHRYAELSGGYYNPMNADGVFMFPDEPRLQLIQGGKK